MKHKIAFMLILLTGCFFSSVPISAGDLAADQKNEILIIGSARIIEENMASARKEALRDAMFKGIESYLISRLGRQEMINNFTLLIQEIMPQATEQIENYHILAQERIGNVYKVFLGLRINEALLEEKLNELDVLGSEDRQVKILFLVSESHPETGEERYWWKDPDEGFALTPLELTLYRLFQEAGFNPVNRQAGPVEEIHDSEMMTPALTLDEAVRWGRLFAADVVIQGRFIIRAGGTVDVDIKAINADDAKLISRLNFEQAADEDMADSPTLSTIKQAARKMIQQLGPALIHSGDKQIAKMTGIRIELSGLDNLKQQKLFLDFVKTRLKGIQSILPVRMKNRSVSFSVKYQGDIESLVRSLNTKSGLPFEAEINIKNNNEISITIL